MSQNQQTKLSKLSRRGFLFAAGAGTAGAVAAVVARSGAQSSAAAPQASGEGREKQGMSEHMRNYYRTTRV